jgi:hypothetical protein
VMWCVHAPAVDWQFVPALSRACRETSIGAIIAARAVYPSRTAPRTSHRQIHG